MPTGYTADVQSGKITEFRDFAMQCARAFGALVTMRDDPSDAPIPDEFEPSVYHAKVILEVQARLDALLAMTPDKAAKAAHNAHAAAIASWTERQTEKAECRKRYEAMLEKVDAWQSPTAQHNEMKKFMAEQLRQSIDFDCSESKYDQPPIALEPQEWLDAEIAEARWNLSHHQDEDRKERQRAAERTQWVRDLRASLEPSP